MNQERFQLFRNSLLSELSGLVKRFPETREYVTVHLEAMVREFEFSNKDVGEKTRGKRRKSRLNKDEIRESLITSIYKGRTVNFDGDLEKARKEDEVLEVLTNLILAVKQHEMLTVYLSCLQGKALKKLKDVSNNARFTELLQLKEMSYSHARFLIKLAELTSEYDKIAYSSLPVRFIKNSFKTIIIVCKENKELFKL